MPMRSGVEFAMCASLQPFESFRYYFEIH